MVGASHKATTIIIQTIGMIGRSDTFIFDGYSGEIEKGEIVFHYFLQHKGKTFKFNEKIAFLPVSLQSFSDTQREFIKKTVDRLSLILGVSYWKIFCPRILKIRHITLTRREAIFWNTLYEKGLGEFFFMNRIDYKGLIQFPFASRAEDLPLQVKNDNRSLVLMGGGKDSIVTGEFLKKHNKDFDLLTVGDHPIQKNVTIAMGKELIQIRRNIDRQLFSLNSEKNAYNGHVPISAAYAFIGLLIAGLHNYSYIVVSNEESASYGNVVYLGSQINHQWSKSFEFENLFREYVENFIGYGIEYFSLLRPVKEVRIVELFTNFPQYFPVFSSCNNNFKATRGLETKKWCGRCPKCAFVFLLLAAFLRKETVLEIIGQNLFENRHLLNTFQEIIGVRGHKPFECVGTPQEAQWALHQIVEKGEYINDIIIRKLLSGKAIVGRQQLSHDRRLFSASSEHNIPGEFTQIIKAL